MALALFDLDNTLLDGDSDFLWGEFLVERGAVAGPAFSAANRRFYQQYLDGSLDIQEFHAYSLGLLAQHDPATLRAWRERFVAERIAPKLSADAHALVAKHRAAGDRLAIVTATNSFVTAPIAPLLGVPTLIGTDPEVDAGGRFTGRVAGVPAFRAGKVTRVLAWLGKDSGLLDRASFYSDSHNDLPLLERVAHPVVVNADPELAAIAAARGWPTSNLGSGRARQLHARRQAGA
jgi:HAD superfamily hydrolase (TIGR01490 family)